MSMENSLGKPHLDYKNKVFFPGSAKFSVKRMLIISGRRRQLYHHFSDNVGL